MVIFRLTRQGTTGGVFSRRSMFQVKVQFLVILSCDRESGIRMPVNRNPDASKPTIWNVYFKGYIMLKVAELILKSSVKVAIIEFVKFKSVTVRKIVQSDPAKRPLLMSKVT